MCSYKSLGSLKERSLVCHLKMVIWCTVGGGIPSSSATRQKRSNIRSYCQLYHQGPCGSGGCRPVEGSTMRIQSLSGKIFIPPRIKWAVNSFKHYKSPGVDGIFPALLKESIYELLPSLFRIFRASYAWGDIPIVWRDVRMVFFPKAVNRSGTEPKSISCHSSLKP